MGRRTKTKNALLKNQKDNAMALFEDLISNQSLEAPSDVVALFIKDWWDKVRVKNGALSNDAEQFQLQFRQFTLQGVLDVLEVLEKHWEGSINWDSWTRPE